ncbi:aegerolysin type hemolysin [Flagelloscypha sp. PMI_526]|nr:aegerolysin type hemolysin [Flagelloscypha sp. PMI_526]
MAYAQWVIIIIHNIGAKNVKVKNLKPSWGKLHADGDKDHELPAAKYEGHVISPDEKLQINACGRSDAEEGTTGDFDLVDPNNGD